MNKKYKNIEEVLEEEELNKKEALKELNRLDIEIRKERKQKLIKIGLPIIVLFILFKIFIGEINLNLPIYYNHRLYEVTLNDEFIDVCVDEYRNIPIIPFLINNNYHDFHCFHQHGVGIEREFNKGDKIHITFDSFECLTEDGFKTSCWPYKSHNIKKETNDAKYSLIINRNYRGTTVIYDGDVVNDITDYFSEKGTYTINIIAKHGNVKSIVFFGIIITE